MQILTVLPKNWSIKRIVEEFGATNYKARQAKKLAQEKGILSSPNLKPGRTLPAATEELVLSVYHNDEVSRTMPGKKDCVSVITKEGKREKRLLLCNLKEAHQHFKVLHPSVKVGFSTFASLRPKECVLAGSSGTHTVCACTHHQTTKLLFIGSKLSVLSHGAFTHYRHCLAAIMSWNKQIEREATTNYGQRHDRQYSVPTMDYDRSFKFDNNNTASRWVFGIFYGNVE